MAICPSCKTQQERPCAYVNRTRECYRAMIAALRHVARRCGYALAVHGSLKTDIDLIAVPWRDSCASSGHLAEEIRKTAEQIIGTARIRECDPKPTEKPCGRLAWSFYLQPDGIEGPYIDLSVAAKGYPDTADKQGGVKRMVEFNSMDFAGVPIRPGAALDYPTAWAIQKEVGETLEHHPRCSSVPGWCSLSGPGILCDCGAVEREYERRLADTADKQGEQTPKESPYSLNDIRRMMTD